ncbi:MAG: hypothetical protein HY074_02305 [Deltaproteobacteria bacterium]|nr:hypothetical protein [Deltaproteobacteria bacterium]
MKLARSQTTRQVRAPTQWPSPKVHRTAATTMLRTRSEGLSQKASVTVYMPEVAGDVAVNIGGRDPNGGTLTADPLIFEVRLKDLLTLSDLTMYFNIGSHSGDGFYATSVFKSSLQNMITKFQTKVLAKTFSSASIIESQGATLSWGGLFDIKRDWQTPHCGHRDGHALDVSWQSLTTAEQQILSDVVDQSIDLSFYGAEAPGTSANHWHVQPK